MKGEYICYRPCRDTIMLLLLFAFGILLISAADKVEIFLEAHLSGTENGNVLFWILLLTAGYAMLRIMIKCVTLIMSRLPKDTPREFRADTDGFEIADNKGTYFFGYNDIKRINCRHINSGRVMLMVRYAGGRALFYEKPENSGEPELMKLYRYINNFIIQGR